MANLYGKLWGNRGTVTRCGHGDINTKLETWNGSVQVTLKNDGTFTVYTGKLDDTRRACNSRAMADAAQDAS